MTAAILPTNATAWERAMADAMPASSAAGTAIAGMRRFKYVAPLPSMLPFLVYEYGLGELRPYVPNLYELLEQGIDWQRIRGTHAAVAQGLGFIGYGAAIEEALVRRRFWNSFQLRFPALPANDAPDLDRIDGIAGLSVPKRSIFRRGVYAYDVGPLVTDGGTRLDGARLEAESGVRRREDGPLWSFGRRHESVHLLTEAEGLAIGNWLDPIAGAELAWQDMTYPWEDAAFPWTVDGATQRAAILGGWFEAHTGYAVLRSAAGVIGYRRLRRAARVTQHAGGIYTVGGIGYQPSAAGEVVYLSALTGFGDGAGATAISIGLAYGVERAPGVPPGRLWLGPDEVVAASEIATTAVDIQLRPTVRDDIIFLLRF